MSDRRERLLRRLEHHQPAGPSEADSLRAIRRYLRWLPAPFDEEADPVHVTVSAIVLRGGEVLLHRHRRLGIWLQPGGHLDVDESPSSAVLREVTEETGLTLAHRHPGGELVHVDVHEGGRGHLHLDLRYLLHAPDDAALRPGAGESTELGWFDPAPARDVTDASVGDALRAALTRVSG